MAKNAHLVAQVLVTRIGEWLLLVSIISEKPKQLPEEPTPGLMYNIAPLFVCFTYKTR